MNLRHIDPRSSDWMDAMMEGEKDKELDAEKLDTGRMNDANTMSSMSMKDPDSGSMQATKRPPPTIR